jgi:phosphoglycolate phosphatase-like HAD superfamily hydrolase
MSMRIAFDMDGVLADLHTAYAKVAIELFPQLDRAVLGSADVGASPPEGELAPGESDVPDPSTPVVVTDAQSAAIWARLTAKEDFWTSLSEIEHGAIARIAKEAEARRWEVLFITSRPRSAGATVQRQSQRWLEAKGFPLPSVFVVHGSRGRIAQALALDAVIDDRPDNCLDVALESRAAAILLWRGSPTTVPGSAKRLGIAVAPTVHACLDALSEAETSAEEGTLLDRVRRLFGLRTKKPSQLLRERHG